ncbi:MAG: LysM peptidoglycan-binding domain-containing protein [Clostridiales bacterium]|jgi:LysM repeat protein|nr:LysM peptidoglycan-binding domain-containing protein [Clostridiales bacterium]
MQNDASILSSRIENKKKKKSGRSFNVSIDTNRIVSNDSHVIKKKDDVSKSFSVAELKFLDDFAKSRVCDFAVKKSINLNKILVSFLIITLVFFVVFLGLKNKNLNSELKLSNKNFLENQNEIDKLKMIINESEELKNKADRDFFSNDEDDNNADINNKIIEEKNSDSVVEYTVESGDTLASISKKFYNNLDYKKIAKDNDLRNDNIMVGQKILIYQ